MTDRPSDESFTIDCDACALQRSDACADCIVTFLCDAQHDAVVVDAAEARALRLLAAGGLVPRLRLLPSGPAA